jgi:hypothetical protein
MQPASATGTSSAPAGSSAGFLFLAGVIDVWNRKVVGWSMATHLRTDLSRHSRDDLHTGAVAFNGRRWKTLDRKTPAEALRDHLCSFKQHGVATTR